MNGAGNDFVLLDNRSGAIRLTRDQVVRLCHRQRGVGADGVLLLEPSRTGKADWAWTFFNSDGSDAAMCGNGARCFARFVQHLTGATDGLTFETGAGVIHATFAGDQVTVGLTPPRALELDIELALRAGNVRLHSIDTGVPHAVVPVTDAEQAPVQSMGREIRFHPHFAPAGTNVNFVQVIEPGRIQVRTYERGVEGETLACGTGVTAAALICARREGFESPLRVRVAGGETLEVAFTKQDEAFTNVRLTGPADLVFTGRIELETFS